MKEAFIKLHLSVILAGFTGIFGKLITLNEGMLVWWRMLFVTIILIIILWARKQLPKVNYRDIFSIGSAGVILSLHWLFFYGSIKASNVSIGVICFSMTGFFTAILDPIINRRRFSFQELVFSLITLLGIALIFHFDMRYRSGIALGTISSALAALFVIVNKKVGTDGRYRWDVVLLYEMIGGLLFVSLIMPFYLHYFPIESFIPNGLNIFYLLLFAVFCTIIMYRFQIEALRHISAFTLNLTYNLEPIYSIMLAMVLFGEAKELNITFYIGLVLIFSSVFLQMYSVMKERVQYNKNS